MDNFSAKLLLKSLLERLAADAQSPNPQFGAVCSKTDRAALEYLIGEPTFTSKSNETETAERIGDVASSTAENQAKHSGNDEQPAGDRTAQHGLNLASLEGSKGESDYIVCIDFGTAKSKAFACRRNSSDPSPEELKELGIGEVDGDLDGSKYSVASSVWISDDGRVYAGSHAMRKSSEFDVAPNRQRIDSIKQELSLVSQEHELNSLLQPEKNPSGTPFSVEDVVCFFLAYLTDMISTDLAERYGMSRYTPRRFTLPAWPEDQRSWAAIKITQYLKRAQILADSFHERWAEGIPINEVTWAIEQAAQSLGDHVKSGHT